MAVAQSSGSLADRVAGAGPSGPEPAALRDSGGTTASERRPPATGPHIAHTLERGSYPAHPLHIADCFMTWVCKELAVESLLAHEICDLNHRNSEVIHSFHSFIHSCDHCLWRLYTGQSALVMLGC